MTNVNARIRQITMLDSAKVEKTIRALYGSIHNQANPELDRATAMLAMLPMTEPQIPHDTILSLFGALDGSRICMYSR